MLNESSRMPDLVPTLSAGKHRSPRKGACFMEMASFLAGERWSDHPACTHPLLAELARQVNDHVGDDDRQRLVPLVPSVIGLTSDDPHVDVRLTLHAAATALPVAPEPTQHALAVAALSGTRVLEALDGLPRGALDDDLRQILDTAPLAARWAAAFSRGNAPKLRGFRRHAAPCAVRLAVKGIAGSAVREPGPMLCGLLEGAIERFPGWAAIPGVPDLSEGRPAEGRPHRLTPA